MGTLSTKRELSFAGFKPGQVVEVRSLAEIQATLDEHGASAGLPFMPEMADFCEQRFRVERRATKVCVEVRPGGYDIREFSQDDVVLLEGLRCSGGSHDGCQRRCSLFWRSSWLKPVDEAPVRERPLGGALNSRTKNRDGSYYCQSTQLVAVTTHLKRSRIVKKCWEDLRTGSRSLWELLGLILRPAVLKLTTWFPRPRLAGDQTKTPLVQLNLQPGQLVRIRTPEEIARTLDREGRNRGLSCDFGMSSMAGKNYTVANRLERMILEPNGQMREVRGTVILEGLECTCPRVIGGCPRREPIYWREAWLEQVAQEMPAAAPNVTD